MDPKKVLLIDDDVDLVTINRNALERHGYVVEAAYNGPDGIAKARAQHPDAIVLDVMMSTNSEGFDAARTLRKDEATRAIPLIMLTSVNSTVPFKFEPDEFLPVDRFLEKPLRPDELVRHLGELLGA